MKNEKKYFNKLGFKGLYLYWLKKFKWQNIININLKKYNTTFNLRVKDADIGTFEKIFIDEEYNFTFEKMDPKIIVDIGANIGASPIYFANRYLNSTVYALEPQKDNFNLLVEHTKNHNNIKNFNYGLWHENKLLAIENPKVESISFTLSDNNTTKTNLEQIQGKTLESFMEENQIDFIDILKIDIEGAEKDIFLKKPRWLNKIGLLIIELHDRKVKGCSRAFYSAINNYTEDEYFLGDNIFIKIKSQDYSKVKK